MSRYGNGILGTRILFCVLYSLNSAWNRDGVENKLKTFRRRAPENETMDHTQCKQQLYYGNNRLKGSTNSPNAGPRLRGGLKLQRNVEKQCEQKSSESLVCFATSVRKPLFHRNIHAWLQSHFCQKNSALLSIAVFYIIANCSGQNMWNDTVYIRIITLTRHSRTVYV